MNIWIEKEKYIPYCSYVLDFINHHPLNGGRLFFELCEDRKTANVEYTHTPNMDNPNAIQIPVQNLFFGSTQVNNRALSVNTYHAKPKNVFAIEGGNRGINDFFDGKRFAFDWIETIFFHLSRYEEYHFNPVMRNQWDMMPEKEQILVKNKLHHFPVVDELVTAILVTFGFPVLNVKSKWSLSHDIDYLSRKQGLQNKIKQFLFFVKYGSSIKSAYKHAFTKEHQVYSDFSFLDSSDQAISKIIYFHVGGDHIFDPGRTEDRQAQIQKLATEALDKGYEIGIHPSYLAAKNDELFQEEKTLLETIIGQKIELSRQHYLHFDFENTLDILEKNNIREDSSLGFNEHVGFRCGTGFNFYLFNWKLKAKSSVIEQPLVWMDSAQRYEVRKQAVLFNQKAIKFLESNKINTQINLNIHNHYWVDYQLIGIELVEILKQIRRI